MRHGLTTAPANPAPQWPSGYGEALREVGAQEEAIPFCIRWVRGFFAEYHGRRRRDLDRTKIEAFLRKVAARPNVTNWQVHPPSFTVVNYDPACPTFARILWRARQVRESLNVQYERFRGIALASRPDGVASPMANDDPAPLRETMRSRPRDQGSTLVRHANCSKYTLVGRQLHSWVSVSQPHLETVMCG